MLNSDSDWVIVSGASGSIGSGIVERFLERDRSVLALDIADEGGGDKPGLIKRAVDLTSEADVDAVLEDLIPPGERVSLLVNTVGLIWNEPVVSLQGATFRPHGLENWRRVIEANLTAPFVIASHVAARMARKGGAIINFSSISAHGNVGQAAYSAAKAGIEGMTRAMACELGRIGIRVNAIAPGFIDVPSTHAALSEDQRRALAEQTPMHRFGQLDEVMDAVDFLAGNEFVNGAVLDLNGGLRI